MIAVVEAYKAGLFRFQYWLPNIIAGSIVGIISIPLSMAFAIASGATPGQGLVTSIIAGALVGIFGGSRVQITGPTGAFIVLLMAITTKHGIEGLQIATLMAGFILVFMGLAKLGNIIKFIPDPVIVGFTSGIGVVIFVSEWRDFFGLPKIPAQLTHFHEKLIFLISSLKAFHPTTTLLAFLSLALILFSSKVRGIKYIPGPLVAVVGVTLIQFLFQFSGVATIGDAFGKISQELPHFFLPRASLSEIIELIGPAFTIALLGAIESLLSAVVADGMIGARHTSNQELIGQGLANIFCPLFGGFAATAAIGRTTTSIRSGGNSPIAALTHSVVILFIILTLAPLVQYIPLCTLAAILFVSSYNMGEPKHFYYMLSHAGKNDILVLLSTFILTIFTDLVVAVNVGVILAIFLFTRRMSQSVRVEHQLEKHIQPELAELKVKSLPSNIIIYNIQGPFFFAAAETLERALSVTRTDPKAIIFRLKDIPFMDITGLQSFREIIEQFYKRDVLVFLCEANPRVQIKLEKIKVLKWVQGECIFKTLTEALHKALKSSPSLVKNKK